MVERDRRRHAKATDHRARAMYRLRADEHLTFRAIGEHFGVSPERVRQILRLYCHTEGLEYSFAGKTAVRRKP